MKLSVEDKNALLIYLRKNKVCSLPELAGVLLAQLSVEVGTWAVGLPEDEWHTSPAGTGLVVSPKPIRWDPPKGVTVVPTKDSLHSRNTHHVMMKRAAWLDARKPGGSESWAACVSESDCALGGIDDKNAAIRQVLAECGINFKMGKPK